MERERERAERGLPQRAPRGDADARRRGAQEIAAAYADPAHLGERLGLFIIIVLGEGVAQHVDAAAGVEWDGELYGFAVAAFVLLVLLWWVSLRHGYGGVPHLAPAALPARIALAVHCFTAGALAAVAAGLGAAAAHLDAELPEGTRLLLCARLAAYILIGWIPWTISMPGAPGQVAARDAARAGADTGARAAGLGCSGGRARLAAGARRRAVQRPPAGARRAGGASRNRRSLRMDVLHCTVR